MTNLQHDAQRKPRKVEEVPSGLWPGSSPELIAAHQRTLDLVASEERTAARLAGGELIRNLVLFPLVLLLTCTAVARIFSAFPGVQLEPGVERQKYEYFARHKDEFDLVFVGSSQVYRHVDPELFDRRVTAAGHPIRSFNFGMPGMFFPEVVHSVDWILEQRPARLKWLFVELRELEPDFVPGNELTRREINWHGPKAASLMLGVIWDRDVPLWRKLRASRWTARHFLHRLGNVALAYPLADLLLGRAPEPRRDWPDGGFLALDVEAAQNPDDVLLKRRRAAFLKRIRAYRRRVERRRNEPDFKEPSPLQVRVWSGLVRSIGDAGIEPVFFLGVPAWSKYAEIYRAVEMGVLPNLLANVDPKVHPEFYDRENLFDHRHLSSEAASRFTELLADDFVRYLEDGDATP